MSTEDITDTPTEQLPPIAQVQKHALTMFNTMVQHYPGTIDAMVFWRDGDALHIIGTRAGPSADSIADADYGDIRAVILDFLQATNEQPQQQEGPIQ